MARKNLAETNQYQVAIFNDQNHSMYIFDEIFMIIICIMIGTDSLACAPAIT